MAESDYGPGMAWGQKELHHCSLLLLAAAVSCFILRTALPPPKYLRTCTSYNMVELAMCSNQYVPEPYFQEFHWSAPCSSWEYMIQFNWIVWGPALKVWLAFTNGNTLSNSGDEMSCSISHWNWVPATRRSMCDCQYWIYTNHAGYLTKLALNCHLTFTQATSFAHQSVAASAYLVVLCPIALCWNTLCCTKDYKSYTWARQLVRHSRRALSQLNLILLWRNCWGLLGTACCARSSFAMAVENGELKCSPEPSGIGRSREIERHSSDPWI